MCDGDCTDLDLALRDASGNILDEDTEESDVPLASVLLDSGGTLQLEVSMWSCSVEPGGILTQYRPILRQGWRAVTLFKDVAWPSTVGILMLGDTITKDWFGPGGVIMRYPRTLAALVFAVAGLTTGCASAGGPVDDTVPQWWTGVTQKTEGAVQGYGTGRSTEMSVARNIARQGGIGEIAQFQGQESSASSKNMALLEGTADADVVALYREASTLIWREVLVGVQQANQEVQRVGNVFTVYVLMEQDPAAVLAAYEAQMKQQEAAYARFRATEVFKEMEEDVKRYEQRQRRDQR